jgi:hypothetical protein
MNKAKFLDKYDKDFVNLMIEIQNRIEDFSKSNKLKINSWAKSLCLPTNNIAWKKNRNLYAIKLLDNILNGKLEKPFTKFADDGENLPMLDPILVKSQLTNKVKEVISNVHPDTQIQNFLNSNFHIMEPDLYDNYNNDMNNNFLPPQPQIIHSKTPNNLNNKILYNKNKLMNEQLNNINYRNIRTSGGEYYDNNYDEYIGDEDDDANYEGAMDELDVNQFNKGDKLLQKNYFNFNQKLSKEPGFYTKTNPYSYASEKSKLESTIVFLENESKIKSQIINQQNNDINQLKKRLSELEKKFKIIFNK